MYIAGLGYLFRRDVYENYLKNKEITENRSLVAYRPTGLLARPPARQCIRIALFNVVNTLLKFLTARKRSLNRLLLLLLLLLDFMQS